MTDERRARFAPMTLEDRVGKIERTVHALTERRTDSDLIHLREFQQRLVMGDGPLARVRRFVDHMRAAHFGICECKNPDDCVRKAYEAIVKICDGDL